MSSPPPARSSSPPVSCASGEHRSRRCCASSTAKPAAQTHSPNTVYSYVRCSRWPSCLSREPPTAQLARSVVGLAHRSGARAAVWSSERTDGRGDAARASRHLLDEALAQRLAARFLETAPLIVHRVSRLDRASARQRYGEQVAQTVPEDSGVVDVHRYLTILLDGQRVAIDATFPDPAWDGRSTLPLVCGAGDDYPAGEDPDADKRTLETKHCDPAIRVREWRFACGRPDDEALILRPPVR
jgi:hypothetical protein